MTVFLSSIDSLLYLYVTLHLMLQCNSDTSVYFELLLFLRSLFFFFRFLYLCTMVFRSQPFVRASTVYFFLARNRFSIIFFLIFVFKLGAALILLRGEGSTSNEVIRAHSPAFSLPSCQHLTAQIPSIYPPPICIFQLLRFARISQLFAFPQVCLFPFLSRLTLFFRPFVYIHPTANVIPVISLSLETFIRQWQFNLQYFFVLLVSFHFARSFTMVTPVPCVYQHVHPKLVLCVLHRCAATRLARSMKSQIFFFIPIHSWSFLFFFVLSPQHIHLAIILVPISHFLYQRIIFPCTTSSCFLCYFCLFFFIKNSLMFNL